MAEAGARSGLLEAFGALQVRDYRLLWLNAVTFFIGGGMRVVAMSWLVLDLTDESRRTVQAHSGFAAETHAQQPVKAREVIHVGMRHENIGDAQQLFRRQCGQVAQVKEQCALLEPEVEVKARIAERAVHELRIENRAHGVCLWCGFAYYRGLAGW